MAASFVSPSLFTGRSEYCNLTICPQREGCVEMMPRRSEGRRLVSEKMELRSHRDTESEDAVGVAWDIEDALRASAGV